MTDYAPSGKPEDNTRGISKQVRDELLLVKTAVNSKIDKNNVVLSRVYDTITGFDSTGLSDKDTVFFRGRDSVNDGGGGWFTFWENSVQPADGGLVFAPTSGGRLFRNGWTAFGFNGDLNVKWFGAKGDGLTDDAASIQAAINTSNLLTTGGVIKFPSGVHIVGATLLLKSNVKLWMYEAVLKLKNSANIDLISIPNGAIDVGIYGGEIDGNKANNTTGNGDGITSEFDGTITHAVIRDVFIHDCDGNGIMLQGGIAYSKYITISGCILQDNNEGGISGNLIEEFSFINNVAINNGTHGVGLIGVGKYGTISGNTASGSGIADNFTAYNTACRHLTVTGNVSRDGANNGIHFGGENIIISNNTVFDPTMHGIVVYSHNTEDVVNVVVSGNVVESAGLSGIWIDRGTEFSITGNIVNGCTQHGILIDGTNTNGVVAANTVKGNGADGIRLENSTQIAINGNLCAANLSDGIQLSNSSECSVTGNNCKDNATPFNESGTSNNNFISGNDFVGNTSDNLALIGSTTILRNNDNSGTNLLASAATITLPKYTDYIVITGTTNITSITASWARRVVTLRFDDVLTVTDGSNLILAGNFVTSFNDTLTLVCDGTSWYEISRSVN